MAENEATAKAGPLVPGKKSPFDNIEAAVTWDGEKIILPAAPQNMTYDEGIQWLARIKAIEEEEINIHEPVNAFPFDGAVAFMKAMKHIYGWVSPQPPRGFFDAGPTMLSVDVGPNERITVLWGKFKVPGIDGILSTGAMPSDGKWIFVIQGKVKKKHLRAVHAVAELTRKLVAEESIYRGKAIELHVDDNGDVNLQESPKFIDLKGVNPAELVFSADLMEQVVTNLFTPIEHTAACRKHRIPLKRGVLLEGPFGTGKTLCANVTAQKCEENGWTFITVHRVTALRGALMFASMYQPAVIFVEDIDREVQGARTAVIDDLLNTIDGIISKGREIITVLTSNAAEEINRAMLRPGRLDAILRIDPPDAEAAQKLMRIYGRSLIAADEVLTESGQELAGQIPAVIRECIERAKLYAISRVQDGPFIIADHDIAAAARGMKRHLDLLRGKVADPETTEHKLGAAFAKLVEKKLTEGDFFKLFQAMAESVDNIKNHVS